MANRIYIAIGLIAILVLAAAFVVPRFLDWDAYKPRMEAMASEALGTDVTIAGRMEFALLPQPRLRIEDVRVGSAFDPVGRAEAVEADFSLMDFLRDRYQVTRLTLISPEINLTVNGNGEIETPIDLAETDSASNVSIANATFENGTVRLTDMRGEEGWQATGVTGDMRLSALRGPFVAQAVATYEGREHVVRLNTSAMNAAGAMQMTAFVRPQAGGYSLTAEGVLATGVAPTFDGQVTYRQQVAAEDNPDGVRGDLVFQSAVTADSARVLLSAFTLMPDEDQAATRLTGQARIELGAERSFEATVSGGVVTLMARDMREDTSGHPYELMRLLKEMPQPMIPPLPGRVSVDIGELGLRSLALREVALEAESDGESWAIERFSGRMAGDTEVAVAGTLSRAAGWPVFDGTVSLQSQRLDALAMQWRRVEGSNPLFGVAARLDAGLQLSRDTMRLTEGQLTFDGTSHDVGAVMRFGDAPTLEVSAALGTLSVSQSAALMAALPAVDTGSTFGASFPEGRLDITAERAAFAGQPISDLSLAARWGGGAIEVERISVADFGGIALADASGRVAGTLDAPLVSGRGQIQIARDAGALQLLGDASQPLVGGLMRSLPIDAAFDIGSPGNQGGQAVAIEGRAGTTDIRLDADIGGGILRVTDGQVSVSLEAIADSGEVLFDQLGLEPIIAGEDGALLSLAAQGRLNGDVETEMSIEGGGERIDFTGILMLGDPSSVRGQGRTSFLFEDMSAVMALANAEGIHVPGVEGMAEIGFLGGEFLALSNISAHLGEAEIGGNLTYATQSNSALLRGELSVDTLDMDVVAAMLGGASSVIGDGRTLWPVGPIDIGAAPRDARGRITIATQALTQGGADLLEDVGFDLSWDSQEVRVRGLTGSFGGGTVGFEAALCCAAQLADKSLTGRFTLDGVALPALVPAIPAAILDGRVDASGQFQGNGDSYASLIASLSGEGSFAIDGLTVERFSPAAFQAAANLDNIVELEAETLEVLVVQALDSGVFAAEEVAGLFSIAAGGVRVSNLAIDGDRSRLLGGGTLRLADLVINSNWTLSTTQSLGGNGLINENTGRIGAVVSGPLTAPERALDLTQMVDAIQMRAYEIELQELERLRLEDEARRRAAAEERARLMENEARRRAEELLAQEQAAEQARVAEEEAERQRIIEDIQTQMRENPPPPPFQTAPNSGRSVTQFPPGALELSTP